jgi:coenzyme F420-dependent glucose-6-phosphate dehydrogenase
LPIEQVARRWVVASDPDAASEAVRPYVDAGLDHLVVHAPGHDQGRFFAQFAADVLPRLRALEPAS